MYKPKSRLQIFLSKIAGDDISRKSPTPKTKDESYLDEMNAALKPKEFFLISVDDVMRPLKSIDSDDHATQKDIADAYLKQPIMFRELLAIGGRLLPGSKSYSPILCEVDENSGEVLATSVYIIGTSGSVVEIVPFTPDIK